MGFKHHIDISEDFRSLLEQYMCIFPLWNFFGQLVGLNLSVKKPAHTEIPIFFIDSSVFLCVLVFLFLCMCVHTWVIWTNIYNKMNICKLFSFEDDFVLIQGFFCCASMVPVWMLWTSGNSLHCTRLLPRIVWRSAPSCWATVLIPPWSTAMARVQLTWLQHLSSGRDWPVSVSRLKEIVGGWKRMLSFQATFLELQKWIQSSRVAAAVPCALKCTGTSDTSFFILPAFLKFRIIKTLLNQWPWGFFMFKIQFSETGASVLRLCIAFRNLQKVGSLGVQPLK